MACGCKKKKQTNLYPHSEQLVLVQCINCLVPLTRNNGLNVPVHLVAVQVTESDIRKWESEGHELTYV